MQSQSHCKGFSLREHWNYLTWNFRHTFNTKKKPREEDKGLVKCRNVGKWDMPFWNFLKIKKRCVSTLSSHIECADIHLSLLQSVHLALYWYNRVKFWLLWQPWDTFVATSLVTIVAIKILWFPWQLQKYFGFHGKNGDTQVAMGKAFLSYEIIQRLLLY